MVAPGKTYNIYKLFDLSVYVGTAPGDTSYSYLYDNAADNPWNGFFVSTTDGTTPIGKEYVSIDEQGYVSWREDVSSANDKVSEFARKALDYAKNHNITATAYASCEENENEIIFENLALGYYLIDSPMGAVCILTSASPEAAVSEKQYQPRLEKLVQEDSKITQTDEGWNSWNDAEIGQTVKFQTTITAKSGAENYVLHDVMDKGLTLDINSISVSRKTPTYQDLVPVYADPSNPVANDKSNYEIKTSSEGITDGCTYEISFSQSFCDSLADDDLIIVSYSATLNDSASINTPNQNKTWLSYGDAGMTSEDYTYTYSWQFDVLKKDSMDSPLANAVFTLNTMTVDEDGKEQYTKLTFSKINTTSAQADEGEGTPAPQSNSYATYRRDYSGTETEITTDDTGHFVLEGLDEGTYYLIEEKAPSGFNKLDEPIQVKIISVDESTGSGGGSGVVSKLNDSSSGGSITGVGTSMMVAVTNETGAILPSTGGIGTLLLFAGCALLLAIAAFLIRIRRKLLEKVR